MTADELALAAWAEAVQMAWQTAQAERARELRGDRTVRTFDNRGLHPYSVEWGRILAIEEAAPWLAPLRDCGGPACDPPGMRRHAHRHAEEAFLGQVQADPAEAFR